MGYLSNDDLFGQLEACIARYGINGGVHAFARLGFERTWTAFRPYSKVEPPAKADGIASLLNFFEPTRVTNRTAT